MAKPLIQTLYRITRLAVTTTMALALAACDSSTIATEDTQTATDPTLMTDAAKILVITQSGGCVRTGPNCAIHTLYENGRVEVKREVDALVEVTGQVDTGLASSFISMVGSTDFNALTNRLPPGRCAGCVDGIDYEYTVLSAGSSVQLSSIEYQFDPAEPFFALTNGLYQSMQDAAPLATQTR